MLEDDRKTDEFFWKKYWDGFRPYRISSVLFSEILDTLPAGRKDFIEIGGYPGTFSIYLKKSKNYDVTILDSFIDREKIREMERLNGLVENSINIIKADLAGFKTEKKYDVVMSNGFIEHFEDVKTVIGAHLDLLKVGGLLFVALPNFLGLNGLAQKLLDKKNYLAHNLSIMDPKNLSDVLSEFGLQDMKISYYGKPCLWLEASAPVGPTARFAVRLFSKALSYIGWKNKLLSPYIVATALK
jgi:SAM-dependent methyltransferase